MLLVSVFFSVCVEDVIQRLGLAFYVFLVSDV